MIYESHHSQERLATSTETKVDYALDTIATFDRQFQFMRKEAEAVERAWVLEQGHIMFNVINAYTRAAKDRQLNGEEAHRLERVGGEEVYSSLLDFFQFIRKRDARNVNSVMQRTYASS